MADRKCQISCELKNPINRQSVFPSRDLAGLIYTYMHAHKIADAPLTFQSSLRLPNAATVLQ